MLMYDSRRSMQTVCRTQRTSSRTERGDRYEEGPMSWLYVRSFANDFHPTFILKETNLLEDHGDSEGLD